MMKASLAPLFMAMVIGLACGSAASADYFQGFETDTAGWDVFGGNLDATRVASGTNGVTSASGNFHAQAAAPGGDPASSALTNWGGYSSTFVPYTTSLEIYLDVSAGYGNDTRFDFSSAINRPDGNHRRDFVFNGGFYDSGDITGPGAGTNRFVFTASNGAFRANSNPKNPARNPVAATLTGWYTFMHEFRDDGAGVLEVELSITDPSNTLVGSWILSDATDIIGSTVGGNRYGWFASNEVPNLAFDNTMLSAVPEPGAFLFGGLVCGVIGLGACVRRVLGRSAAGPADA